MTDFIQIHWNSGSIDEARKVSRYLVQERLVACANIIPWIESIYMWNNKMETAQETKVIFKTHVQKFDAVKKIIKENTTYEVPEILKITIDDGNQEYLDWLADSTVSGQVASK
jgi:periplasmic divalent cation tolerance protein